MNIIHRAGCLVLIACLGLSFVGCDNKVLDPTQIGRFRPTPAVNVILDSLGVAEETPVAWENAEAPRQEDIIAVQGDYRLRGGDLVRISIFELFQEGAPVVNDYVVSESGKISIPEVGVVQAAGLTETQLEEEIRQILSPAILKKPSITVTLMNSQQRTYSILGNGVPQPGRYPIPRYDFRLSDALATAGGPMQFNVSHIYIARPREMTDVESEDGLLIPGADELELIEPGGGEASGLNPAVPANSSETLRTVLPREVPSPSEPAERYELEREMLDLIAPSAKNEWPSSAKIVTPPGGDRTEMPTVSASVMPGGFRLLVPGEDAQKKSPRGAQRIVTPSEFGDSKAAEPSKAARPRGRVEWVFQNGKWVPISVESGEEAATRTAEPQESETTDSPGEQPPSGAIEWVLREGRWMPKTKDVPGPTQSDPVPDRTGMGPTLDRPVEAERQAAGQTRLIRVPADQLLAGDARYNIVIKPGDTVFVPVDIIGEFCITGNVNQSGFIGITGRPMTLKMAIAAAGGLGPLAYPKHCEVIRRIGENREEIVMVDLDKIASGEQPDFFIKPNDLINVGTHPTSRWRAVLRNAFRAAYGFGFVYDRNFAYSDDRYGTGFF